MVKYSFGRDFKFLWKPVTERMAFVDGTRVTVFRWLGFYMVEMV